MNVVARSENQSGAKGRILIVEDHRQTNRALGLLLEQNGYEPALFDNGLAAIESARQSPPIAALVDIHLPDISGLEVTQQLREILGEKTPIIILSGDHSMETLRTLPNVGATFFLGKPLNVATLIDSLKKWVDGGNEE